MPPILALACSPRQGGNTDAMTRHFARGVREAGGDIAVVFLRETPILPCTACGFCARDAAHRCALASRDGADALLRRMEEAPLVFMAAPIFFYALPAQLKALIDRGQRLWARREQGVPPPPVRPAMAGLAAARQRGEKLFEGSLLTLRCFLDLFPLRLVESRCLRGYDGPGDLDRDPVACRRCHALGVRAQALINGEGVRDAAPGPAGEGNSPRPSLPPPFRRS